MEGTYLQSDKGTSTDEIQMPRTEDTFDENSDCGSKDYHYFFDRVPSFKNSS